MYASLCYLVTVQALNEVENHADNAGCWVRGMDAMQR